MPADQYMSIACNSHIQPTLAVTVGFHLKNNNIKVGLKDKLERDSQQGVSVSTTIQGQGHSRILKHHVHNSTQATVAAL